MGLGWCMVRVGGFGLLGVPVSFGCFVTGVLLFECSVRDFFLGVLFSYVSGIGVVLWVFCLVRVVFWCLGFLW